METVVGLKGFEPLWLPAKPRSGVNQMRDKAVENVWRDYEQIASMPLIGKQIGLAHVRGPRYAGCREETHCSSRRINQARLSSNIGDLGGMHGTEAWLGKMLGKFSAKAQENHQESTQEKLCKTLPQCSGITRRNTSIVNDRGKRYEKRYSKRYRTRYSKREITVPLY